MTIAVSSKDLCTVAELAPYLGATLTQEADVLQMLITAASLFVISCIGYDPHLLSYVETRNGYDTTSMPTKVRPIIAVTSVTIDDVAIPARPSTQGNGFINGDTLVYLSGYMFTRGFKNVVLAYSAGYASIPEDLKQVVIELAANKFKRRARIGMTSVATGRETTSYNKEDLSPEAKVTLQSYERVGIFG